MKLKNTFKITYILKRKYTNYILNYRFWTKTLIQNYISKLQVRAQDNGQPTSQTKVMTLSIRLLDIDDNEPSFASYQQPYTMNVTEEQPDALVGTIIQPIDADSDPQNKRICYNLYGMQANSSHHFLYLHKQI